MVQSSFLMKLKDRLISRKSLIFKVVLLLIIIMITVIVAVWLSGSFVHTLRPGEIHEYMGQNLSLIDDFRENSIKGPQRVDINSYELTVTSLTNVSNTFSYYDVVNGHTHYEKVVTLHCVEGWDATILWEGILVKDLLDQVGVDSDGTLVIFYAYDGYSTSLPRSFIIDHEILLAYKMNGLVLPPERGFPFQLVAESKYGYKWIKWVTKIELSNDENYRGYWESRGFSNDATVL